MGRFGPHHSRKASASETTVFPPRTKMMDSPGMMVVGGNESLASNDMSAESNHRYPSRLTSFVPKLVSSQKSGRCHPLSLVEPDDMTSVMANCAGAFGSWAQSKSASQSHWEPRREAFVRSPGFSPSDLAGRVKARTTNRRLSFCWLLIRFTTFVEKQFYLCSSPKTLPRYVPKSERAPNFSNDDRPARSLLPCRRLLRPA